MIKLTCRGETRGLKDWGDELGLPFARLYRRYRMGWTPEEILEFEDAPTVKERNEKRERSSASYNQQSPVDLPAQHPDSTVYAVIDGQVVKLDRAPGWMSDTCQ